MQATPEEKRRQQIRERLQKKREEKYGPNSGRPKEPWEIKRDALMKFKTATVKGLVDFIASVSGMLDIMINQKSEQSFYMVGEFLESINNQLLTDDPNLEVLTYASQMRAAGALNNPDLPDKLVIPRKDIEMFMPFIRDFMKGTAASFLNTFEQYY